MTRKTKFFTAIALIGLVAVIGFREISKSCGGASAAGGHSHGEESQEAAGEGFGTRLCEIGFFSALGEKVGLSGVRQAGEKVSAADEPAGHAHGDKEADGHTHGAPSDGHAKDADGHEHGPKETGGQPATDSDGHAHGEKEKDGHAHGAESDGHAKEPDGHEHGAGEPAGHQHGAEEAGHSHSANEGKESEGLVKLTPEQIANADIDTASAGPATLVKEIAVPGRIALNADKQAKIVPKLSGTVASINKRLGEEVAKGDVLATIESREVADAKSQYLEAWRAEELAKSVFEREERLWKQKVTAEQEYLNAKNAFETSKIQLELAHQKLHTMGLEEEDIEAVIKRTGEEIAFRTYVIRSPIAGRVTARSLILGEMVATEAEIFNIADLATVWVDLAVQPADLPFAKEGQEVVVSGEDRTGRGKIVALSPVIDPETRSARAIAEIDNSKGEWQLGDYVRAQLISGRQEVSVAVPRDAIQTINGQKSVFVAEPGGFKARPLTTGREDSQNVEVLSGLKAGENVAVKNTFALKAELGKAEAEHEH
jgi:cobalt-zinc-cadmium efflux system membrane fusion protein